MRNRKKQRNDFFLGGLKNKVDDIKISLDGLHEKADFTNGSVKALKSYRDETAKPNFKRMDEEIEKMGKKVDDEIEKIGKSVNNVKTETTKYKNFGKWWVMCGSGLITLLIGAFLFIAPRYVSDYTNEKIEISLEKNMNIWLMNALRDDIVKREIEMSVEKSLLEILNRLKVDYIPHEDNKQSLFDELKNNLN